MWKNFCISFHRYKFYKTNMSYLNSVVRQLPKNPTKLYLLTVNVLLIIFGIWFSNVGVLPFKNTGDFVFFVLLVLALGIYRPAWLFLFFIGTLPLEIVNLAPESLGIAVRPYQLFGAFSILGLFVQYATGRLPFALPKFRWPDVLTILFALSGIISALFAASKGMSLKQAIVACSFAALYFLVRVYVQDWNDLKRVAPFFLSSSIAVVLYGILQNILFAMGRNSFEVMPGRPNGTFSEADWLGIFLVFVLAAIYTINYKFQIANIFRQSYFYIFLLFLYISIILTVSRSAWLGALIVTLPFLKLVALKGTAVSSNKKAGDNFKEIFKLSRWDWRGFGIAFAGVIVSLILSIGIINIFNLTTFQLGSRAQSTGGLQKITIACEAGKSVSVPTNISGIEELSQYGCRHINLEDINKEKEAGFEIAEVYRPDPNVGIRAKIYKTSWEQIRQHSIFGIGWGSIGDILGRDERGAALNASNIFLETWLGAGLIGFLSLVVLLGYLLFGSIFNYIKGEQKTSVFIMLATIAIIVPNLFNSGIFLGFLWAYLGAAVSLMQSNKE